VAVIVRGVIPEALADYRAAQQRRLSATELQDQWNEDTAQDYNVMFGREGGIVVGSLVHPLSPIGQTPGFK
jgi:hypothetical protein